MTTRLDAMRDIPESQSDSAMTKDEYQAKSNERLKTIMMKRIETTMIGALDVIEKEINELTRNLPKSDSIMLKDAYSRIRSKILDNGNNQKRAVNEEMKHYTVSWNMYTMTIPVKPRENSVGNRGIVNEEFVIVKEGK